MGGPLYLGLGRRRRRRRVDGMTWAAQVRSLRVPGFDITEFEMLQRWEYQ